MKIGLIDVDGHNFPNLALMKISAWHKQQKDEVEWFFGFNQYDRVYMSKVFSFTDDFTQVINAKEVLRGGTGYFYPNGGKPLTDEIENSYPDYSLYNIKDTAYGFLTRGCPRHCPFCIVGDKEGTKSYKVADLSQFWHGQKYIELCDPNLLACKDKNELLQQLVDSKAKIDFNQGLDIRLMTEEAIEFFLKMKEQHQLKMIHFAWDRMNQSDLITKNLKAFKEATQIDFRRLRVYVLVNFETTMEENLYRIYKLKELGYDPYVMVFEKWRAPREIKRLQRWVNNKIIFRSCKRFEDYKS